MRLAALLLALFVLVSSSPAQKQLAHSPRILNAKTVFFLNTTGSDAVGSEALAQLKKWGKNQIGSERSHADLLGLPVSRRRCSPRQWANRHHSR